MSENTVEALVIECYNIIEALIIIFVCTPTLHTSFLKAVSPVLKWALNFEGKQSIEILNLR